jgi:hypothetical protein
LIPIFRMRFNHIQHFFYVFFVHISRGSWARPVFRVQAIEVVASNGRAKCRVGP